MRRGTFNQLDRRLAKSATTIRAEELPLQRRKVTSRKVPWGSVNAPILVIVVLFTVAVGVATMISMSQHSSKTSISAMAVGTPICGTWQITLTPSYFTSLDVLSKDHIWFAGTAGNEYGEQQPSFARWNGTDLETIPGPDIEADKVKVWDLAVRNDSDAWAVGYTSHQGYRRALALHWNGANWMTVATPDPLTSNEAPSANKPPNYDSAELTAVTIISRDDVWAVGHYEADGIHRTLTMHWGGTAWVLVSSPNIDDISRGGKMPSIEQDNLLYTVVSLSRDNVWAFGVSYDTRHGGKSLAMNWDGEEWQIGESPKLGPISDAAIDQSRNIWVMNGTYNAENWLGSAMKGWGINQWSEALMPKIEHPILSSISAYSPDDVWVVGSKWSGHPAGANSSQRAARSLIIHWDGASWTEVPGPDPSYIQQLYDVSVVDSVNIWAVGTTSENEDNEGNGMVVRFVRCPNAAK